MTSTTILVRSSGPSRTGSPVPDVPPGDVDELIASSLHADTTKRLSPAERVQARRYTAHSALLELDSRDASYRAFSYVFESKPIGETTRALLRSEWDAVAGGETNDSSWRTRRRTFASRVSRELLYGLSLHHRGLAGFAKSDAEAVAMAARHLPMVPTPFEGPDDDRLLEALAVAVRHVRGRLDEAVAWEASQRLHLTLIDRPDGYVATLARLQGGLAYGETGFAVVSGPILPRWLEVGRGRCWTSPLGELGDDVDRDQATATAAALAGEMAPSAVLSAVNALLR